MIADESIIVVKGSALQALEKDDRKCIVELISALDKIPLPKRLQVVHLFLKQLNFYWIVISLSRQLDSESREYCLNRIFVIFSCFF